MTTIERFMKIDQLAEEYSKLDPGERIASITAIYGGKITAQLVELVREQEQRIQELEKQVRGLQATTGKLDQRTSSMQVVGGVFPKGPEMPEI